SPEDYSGKPNFVPCQASQYRRNHHERIIYNVEIQQYGCIGSVVGCDVRSGPYSISKCSHYPGTYIVADSKCPTRGARSVLWAGRGLGCGYWKSDRGHVRYAESGLSRWFCRKFPACVAKL